MKLLFTTITLVISLALVRAQCPTGIISLSSQSDVDAFGTDWPNCTDLPGSLYISSQDLTSLAGLQNLNTIAGYLKLIDNDTLPNLSGLDGLTSIGGECVIYSNQLLSNLTGLDNLTTVGGALQIVYNDSLTEISGLDNLYTVGGALVVSYNLLLTGVSSLSNVNSISGELEITGNEALLSLSGLDNIPSVGGDLEISGNTQLTSLSGLSGLHSVSGWLTVSYNTSLTSLEGLENLTTIGDNVFITGNNVLFGLSNLENLTNIGGDMVITFNPMLTICDFLCEFLQNYDPTTQNIDIHENAPGCSSEVEILVNCMGSTSYVTGLVFADLACDSTFSETDAVLQNYLITKIDGTPVASTNNLGEYLRLVPSNSTNIFSIEAPMGYEAKPDTHQVVTGSTAVVYTGYDFRLCPSMMYDNANINVAGFGAPPRPGFNHTYQLCFENIGTQVTDVTIVLTFTGDAAQYLTIVDAAGGMIQGSSILWNVGDVPVFTQDCFMVTVSMSPDAPLGNILIADASILVVSDVVADSHQNIHTVVGSYDPNDKTVSPTEIEFWSTNETHRLTYTVRFQNTGNYPASFVEILDTIEPTLDLKTLDLLSSSHPFTLTVIDDHILKFRFDNINLPDSTSDEPNSHGYVMFSLETMQGLQLGDIVSNSAAIYFDYNAPIITNTATTELVTTTSSGLPTTLLLQVQPNPARFAATIVTGSSGTIRVELLNLLGEVLQSHQTSGGSHTIDVSALLQGVYIIRVTDGSAIGTTKFIKA